MACRSAPTSSTPTRHPRQGPGRPAQHGRQPSGPAGRVGDFSHERRPANRDCGALASAASARSGRESRQWQRERQRVARGQLRGQLAREVSALQADLLGKLRREMPEGDVDDVRERRLSAWPKRSAPSPPRRSTRCRASPPRRHPPRGPRRRSSTPSFPQPETHPSLYPQRAHAPPPRTDARGDTGARVSPSAWPSSTSPARQPGTATAAGVGGGAHRRRRGAARQRAPRRRAIQARGGRALGAGPQPGHRRGACREPSGCCGLCSELEGLGGPSDPGLGGRRRLPRARGPTPTRFSTTPTKRCGGRARSDNRSASAAWPADRRLPPSHRLQDRSQIGEICPITCVNLAIRWENSGRRRTTAPRPNQIDDP